MLKANCQTLSNFRSAADVSLGRQIFCEDMTIFLQSHEISSMTFGVFFVIGVNTTRVIKKNSFASQFPANKVSEISQGVLVVTRCF